MYGIRTWTISWDDKLSTTIMDVDDRALDQNMKTKQKKICYHHYPWMAGWLVDTIFAGPGFFFSLLLSSSSVTVTVFSLSLSLNRLITPRDTPFFMCIHRHFFFIHIVSNSVSLNQHNV